MEDVITQQMEELMSDETDHAIALDVLRLLLGRKGFEWWWDEIGVEMQDEIFDEMMDVIKVHLDEL